MNSINNIFFKGIRFFSLITIACVALTGSSPAADLELDSQTGTLGANVVFTITVNNAPNDASAIGLEVTFDSTRLEYQSFARGDLTTNFFAVDANEYTPGILRMGFVADPLGDPIFAGSTGTLATITFKDKACLPSNLEFQWLVDHIATWSWQGGSYTCAGDNDSDGISNATDNCPSVFNPAQTDTDNDGYGDVCDNCPGDSDKLFPGDCGCGIAETDTDSDGYPDCIDECPDSAKAEPGVCGCDTSDMDRDYDGTPDCIDECPTDRYKSVAGECGCGTLDTDTDGDGTADCNDECPDDPAKTAPGTCGCGIADTDANGDGTPDCIDANDDSDGDGAKDKKDNCPDVANLDQADTDGDGTGDACDECPDDPDKITPGECGCGNSDTDTDGDGTADCNDLCPKDMDKTEPGVCGCHKPDIDRDGDGDMDCRGGSSACFMDTIRK